MPNSSGELVPADLAAFTQGRLSWDDAETAEALDRALAAARRFCGWHVTPMRIAQTVTLDGPQSRLLALPTLRLIELIAITENGTALNASTDVYISARGLVRKRDDGYWAGNFGAIEVTMTHGFSAGADFNTAVLSAADRISLTGVGGRPRVVGPFQYDTEAMSTGSAFSSVERALLEQYRLESPP